MAKSPLGPESAVIEWFLTWPAVNYNVSALKRNLTLCALVPLYKHVSDMEINEKRPGRLARISDKRAYETVLQSLAGDIVWVHQQPGAGRNEIDLALFARRQR